MLILDSSGIICSGAGLVGYWKFDEGSGQIASDSSGNGNDGIVKGATWTVGAYNNALDFEASEKDYVQVPDSPTLNITNEITIAFWMNPESYANYIGVVAKTTIGSSSYEVKYRNFGVQLVLRVSGIEKTSTIIPLGDKIGEWHHIAFTYDGSKMCSYLDGQPYGLCTPASGNIDTNNGQLVIGRRHSIWSGDQYDGILDNVIIYNRALSDSEIRTLAS